MKIKIIESKEIQNRKCTLHKTGDLGFSNTAIKEMNVADYKSVTLGVDEEDNDNKCLFLRLNKNEVIGDYKIKQAGGYYTVKSKAFFDELKINYEDTSKTIIFDIEDFEYEGEQWYKLKKREVVKVPRNKKNERL